MKKKAKKVKKEKRVMKKLSMSMTQHFTAKLHKVGTIQLLMILRDMRLMMMVSSL
jgi:hypothetical protein